MTCNSIEAKKWEVILNYLELPIDARTNIEIETIEDGCHLTGYLLKQVANELCAAKIDIPLNTTLLSPFPPSLYVTFASMDDEIPQICLTEPYYIHSEKTPVLLSLLHLLDPKQFPLAVEISLLTFQQRIALTELLEQLLPPLNNNVPLKKL